MSLRRLRVGEWIVFFASVALAVSTFLPWYGYKVPATTGTGIPLNLPDQTAWDALTVVLAFALLAAAVGLALGFLTATQRSPALPVAFSVFATLFGIVATILVAYRVGNPPGPNAIFEIEYGAWIGLAGAASIAAGAWMAMADERPTGP
jgi:hypothetical protein